MAVDFSEYTSTESSREPTPRPRRHKVTKIIINEKRGVSIGLIIFIVLLTLIFPPFGLMFVYILIVIGIILAIFSIVGFFFSLIKKVVRRISARLKRV